MAVEFSDPTRCAKDIRAKEKNIQLFLPQTFGRLFFIQEPAGS
jgi:hypothetical protein